MQLRTRRQFLTNTTLLLTAPLIGINSVAQKESKGGDKDEEVTATEDLMREHGILRRTLIVYSEIVPKLRQNAKIDISAVHLAAQLFRSFGEEYHETKLEEAYIFPAAEKIGGTIATLAQVLLTQHKRGREITEYVIRITAGKLQSKASPLADVLEGFVRMYRAHAAREDTILFPAWKKTMNEGQFRELSEKFEEIEHQQFGKDGFDDAVKQISSIEEALGISDLKIFTAPVLQKS